MFHGGRNGKKARNAFLPLTWCTACRYLAKFGQEHRSLPDTTLRTPVLERSKVRAQGSDSREKASMIDGGQVETPREALVPPVSCIFTLASAAHSA